MTCEFLRERPDLDPNHLLYIAHFCWRPRVVYVGHSFWIRTQRPAVACRRATNLATHLPPNLTSQPFTVPRTAVSSCPNTHLIHHFIIIPTLDITSIGPPTSTHISSDESHLFQIFSEPGLCMYSMYSTVQSWSSCPPTITPGLVTEFAQIPDTETGHAIIIPVQPFITAYILRVPGVWLGGGGGG